MYWKPLKFEKQEANDLSLFMGLAQCYPSTFTTLFKPKAYGSFFDVAAMNSTGGTMIIELKLRSFKALTYTDCFIECGKWQRLIAQWRDNGISPYYINFFGDGEHPVAVIWKLNDIMEPLRFYPNLPIENDGESEHVDRIGLPWNLGLRLEWDDDKKKYVVTRRPPIATTSPNYMKKKDFEAFLNKLLNK